MKKIVDDLRLIYKVCCLYYEDDMKQQEISDYLGISRATVSRMLQMWKEQGLIKIEVINPVKFSYGKLEKALEKKYGLKDVIIVEGTALDTKEEASTRLYEEAAIYLAESFREGEHIGVSMGYTLHNVAMSKVKFSIDKQLKFVPLIGGVSHGTEEGADVQSNQIAKEFADKFGGTYTQFLAPAVFSKRTTLDYFLQEESVNFIFDEFKKLSTIIMGIGIPERTESTLIRAKYTSIAEMDEFVKMGAVGDVSLQFFDENGDREKFKHFNERVAAMPFEIANNVPRRIGIVAGAKKAKAVKSAIAGKYINILITNIDCANALL